MHSVAASAWTSPPAILRRVRAATVAHERLYRPACSFYTALVIKRKSSRKPPPLLLYTSAACFLLIAGWPAASAQGPQQKPTPEPATKSTEKVDKPEKPAHPAQIELLETKVRFETNGDSRKEVHAMVKIHSELGVRQFAQLNFDFNRSFESVEIPMVHITHSSGGTADILPSAVTDRPNPAVVNAPAYQDVRVKSVRILGLQPGDTLEYRVIRTVSHHPLAPDFWLDHSFDRTGVVSHEIFELDLPASRFEQQPTRLDVPRLSMHGADRSSKPGRIYISPQTPETSRDRVIQGGSARLVLRWDFQSKDLQKSAEDPTTNEIGESDIALSTFATWSDLAIAMGGAGTKSWSTGDVERLREMAGPFPQDADPNRGFYERISRRIKTIDLPFDVFMFLPRSPFETLSNGYGTAYAKAIVFQDLAVIGSPPIRWLFFSLGPSPEARVPRPTSFSHVLLEMDDPQHPVFLDPSMEVAPYGFISANLRGGKALRIDRCPFESQCWLTLPQDLPFPSRQRVNVDATFGTDGKLTAKVHYSMRGDNELVLRVAFHHTPKERWKEIAQLLSITDGFRGQVSSVNTSDPYATKEPFTVEYELDQPKFVDWSKKPVRIPALLPQLGLPDPPAKPAPGSAMAPIDLGTPLEVETRMTLHLPPGTSASVPPGTSVERDYATYSSQYSASGSTLTATRRIKFVLRIVPAARAADYNAFLRAVRSDEAQEFTLEPTGNPAQKTNSAAPDGTTPPKPVTPKP